MWHDKWYDKWHGKMFQNILKVLKNTAHGYFMHVAQCYEYSPTVISLSFKRCLYFVAFLSAFDLVIHS